MSASHALIKTVGSVRLVFGLDWFAILGGTVSREVRRIARQQKASHVVHAADDAVSVGVISLAGGKRSAVYYSAAQLVAQRFSTGVVALIIRLDHARWWLVAVHEGAIIARTDYVCTTCEEAKSRLDILRHAYPGLTLLDDEEGESSLAGLADTVHDEARLRTAPGSGWLPKLYTRVLLPALVVYVFYHAGLLGSFFDWREPQVSSDVSTHEAWSQSIRELSAAHWVHGVAGSTGLLLSLYALPVQLEGWRLRTAECIAHVDLWRCHADYDRADPDTDNDRFLGAAQPGWEVSFTPLEQARIRWGFPAAGRELAQSALYSRSYIERSVFSALQAIRPAFASMTLDAPEQLLIPVPRDEQGQPVARPSDLPRYGMRAMRIRAPLRSISLLLPHARAVAWRRVVLSVDPNVRPDLVHSSLNVDLQGALYEQD